MRRSLFTDLEAEWPNFARSAAAADRLSHWTSADPSLEFADLAELVRFAQTPGHAADSDVVLSRLAALAPSDSVAARALLQAVLFGLPPIAAAFRVPSGGDFQEAAAIVVAAAYQRIRTYPFERRPRHVAANILLDTRQFVSRQLCRPRLEAELIGDLADLPIEDADASPALRLLRLVEEAVRAKAIRPADARVILLTRVLDVPTDELAAERGCKPHSLRQSRLRAEAALAAAVA